MEESGTGDAGGGSGHYRKLLILRNRPSATQFLPSPGQTLDTTRGVLLADSRNTRDEFTDGLAAISSILDRRGLLIIGQHLSFSGLTCQIEGGKKSFWEALSRAIRVSQRIRIHNDAAMSRQGVHETDNE